MAAHKRYQIVNKSLRTRRLFDKGIVCIMCTYIVIFIVASVILVGSLRSNEPPVQLPQGLPLNLYQSLSKSDIALFDALNWPHKTVNLLFNCSALNEAKYSLIASGWTKSIYKFIANGKSYALKMINPNGEGMTRCLATDNFQNCHMAASTKLVREYILAQELRQANIIKVLGWCILDLNFVMVTELCRPFTTLNFLTMNFTDRFRVSLHAARLLRYLSQTPIGSVGLTDFRIEQFVLCNNRLTLTDLDDISLEEPKCIDNVKCRLGSCNNNICDGHNHLRNVQFVVQDIVNLTLAYDTPISVRPALSKLLLKQNSTDSIQLLMLLENLCAKLKKINQNCV